MDAINVVVVRGIISGEPQVRELPGGGSVTQFDISTRVDGRASSVPVSVPDAESGPADGDEVVIIGHVNRRFFRAGGITQSRTEVVAEHVVPARRTATVRRRIGAVIDGFAT